jgi:predicted nucleic acid-binding protein
LSLYLDTSVLVAALTRELATGRTLAWLAAQAPGVMAVSDWVTTEFSSALSIKLRRREIGLDDRADAMAAYNHLRVATFVTLPFSAPQFHAAARFADQHVLALRGSDALHLAICAHHGATLCTLDEHLADAGGPLGIATARL